jgi:glucose-1-phosphate thymidylyltransferase
MKKLKLVLPVAGVGRRLRPHTLNTPKVLLKVAGKPILGHILDGITNTGVDEIIFIVGYRGEQIESYVKDNFSLKTRFIKQEEQLGLGHAIYLTGEYVEPSDDLLVLLGDTIFDTDMEKIIKSEKSLIGVKEVENPSRFGVVKLKDGRITGFVEKPDSFVSNLAIVGIYFFKEPPVLFKALQEIIEEGMKTKGEYQLTDALQKVVATNRDIGVYPVEGWFDCGEPETLLSTNRYLLEKHQGKTESEESKVLNPVYIGKNSVLERSIVGPYSSIGDGCKIVDSIVENSIIDNNSAIERCLLKDSIIGKNSFIKCKFHSLNVGDFTTIVDDEISKK